MEYEAGTLKSDIEGQYESDDSKDNSKDASKMLEEFGSSFSDRAVRARFIKKVYAIILLQLAISAAIVAVFAYTPQIERFYRGGCGYNGFIIYIVSYVIFFITYLTIVCCEGVRRNYPGNVVVMGIFTLSLSFLMGSIAVFHDVNWIMTAMGLTAGLCLVLSLFAFQTKYDFTGLAFYLFGLGWCLLTFGIIALAFLYTGRPILHAVYCGLAATLFSCFLIFDTQRIMGGKKHSISAEDHMLAAIQIYVDIVNIFLAVVGLGRS